MAEASTRKTRRHIDIKTISIINKHLVSQRNGSGESVKSCLTNNKKSCMDNLSILNLGESVICQLPKKTKKIYSDDKPFSGYNKPSNKTNNNENESNSFSKANQPKSLAFTFSDGHVPSKYSLNKPGQGISKLSCSVPGNATPNRYNNFEMKSNYRNSRNPTMRDSSDKEERFHRSTPMRSVDSNNIVAASSRAGHWEAFPDVSLSNERNFTKTNQRKSNEFSLSPSSWNVSYENSFNSDTSLPSPKLKKSSGTIRDETSHDAESKWSERKSSGDLSVWSFQSNYNSPFRRSAKAFSYKSSMSPSGSEASKSLSNSRRTSSSYEVFDEYSSEEESYWNKDICFERTYSDNYRSKNLLDLDVSSAANSSCGSYDLTYTPLDDSEAENDLRKTNAHFFYSAPVDIDSISSNIDDRLVGKHDDWIHSGCKKVFILGDSHTRFLVNIMEQIFPGFRIYTICKPSAKIEQVFSGVNGSIFELTERDFLILLCGTNDMWSESIERAQNIMATMLDRIKSTNVLVCNVPRNYSEPNKSYVQDNIRAFNKFLKEKVEDINNIDIIKLNKLKKKFFFTKHGLHFNIYGKIKICELLSHKLVDIMNEINP